MFLQNLLNYAAIKYFRILLKVTIYAGMLPFWGMQSFLKSIFLVFILYMVL